VIEALAQAADLLLQELGMTAPPVDVLMIAGHLGLTVARVDSCLIRRLSYQARLPCKIAGFLWRPTMTIVVNSGEQQTRQRFTIAHEVGEYLFPKEGEQYADQERAMNYFASELLMPRAWVQSEWERWQEIERRGYPAAFLIYAPLLG
jgi:hypothetical protein